TFRRGLEISAIGNGANVSFQRFAVVALLKVPIPVTTVEGNAYSIYVENPSATSDGNGANVSLVPMPAATIIVTNVPYFVGDASPGRWYNAGQFGNHDLDNADVNAAFYASTGIRVPFPFTDAYDSMDVFPQDVGPGFVSNDGLIG